ncbi:DUF3413 domain-containing protein [Corallincola spongiicola]|uniref:DUF3413 domain-containing protein n=1 Tax=Corallincola spongiicola TaxID=2520508 RepID=A0ABY1WUG1_9GAMM|nr:DUF3413 domain-containing protein [Corallincola spongiicola]TAA48317.1 DUF3413 domain-containing protein [Corallincola spongiicola]
MTKMTFSELDYRDKVSRLVSWGHWFTFANALIAMAVALGFVFVAGIPDTILAQLFLFIYWAGHFSFITFIIFLVLLFPLAFILTKPLIMQIASAVLASIGVSLLIADLLFFNAYRLHLNLFAFELALSPEGGLLDLELWQAGALFSGLFIVELIIGIWLWRRPTRSTTRKWARTTAAALTVSFFLSHFIHVWADALFYTPITSQQHYFPLSYPATAKTFLREHGWVDVDKYAKEFREQTLSNKTLEYGKSKLPLQAPQSRPNVLLIVIESWRSDMLNEEATPNLHQLAQSGLNYRNHFSGGNNPQEGLFSLLYGIPATYMDNIKRTHTPPVISSAFESANYQQVAFTSSRKLGETLSDTAFSKFDIVQGGDPALGNAANDTNIVRNWRKWVKSRDMQTPYFAVVGFSSPSNFATPTSYNSPFQPDFEGVHLFSDTDLLDQVQLSNRYKNSLHYVDSLIPQVLAPLTKDASLEHTLVIVTSDHGMQLSDKNSNHWGYNSNYSSYQTQVPLIYVAPDVGASEITKLTSHYDLSAQLIKQLYGSNIDTKALTSGIALVSDGVHPWLFLGNDKYFAILESDRLTELKMSGQYKIYTRQNKRDREARLRVTPMREVLEELRRFYGNSQ